MPDSAKLADPPPAADLAALRAEIDALDDALHDLVMRRVAVVARLAASRAKGEGTPFRPGREAAILRRLLARHAGPLPRAALVRLWRELIGVHTALQAPLTVAAWLEEPGIEVVRAHLGLLAEVTRCPDAAAALAAAEAGGASLVALPPAGRWWRTHYPARLSVCARTMSRMVMLGNSVPHNPLPSGFGSAGPEEPMQPPSTLAQMTKYRSVSIGRPGPTTASHQPGLPVRGCSSATYWSPVSAWQTSTALLRAALRRP